LLHRTNPRNHVECWVNLANPQHFCIWYFSYFTMQIWLCATSKAVVIQCSAIICTGENYIEKPSFWSKCNYNYIPSLKKYHCQFPKVSSYSSTLKCVTTYNVFACFHVCITSNQYNVYIVARFLIGSKADIEVCTYIISGHTVFWTSCCKGFLRF